MPWNFTRSVFAQFGVLFVGFVAHMGPLVYTIVKRWIADEDYRSFRAVKASLMYYGGELGPRFAQSTAALLSLLDVQQITISYNAFASLRCQQLHGHLRVMREQPDVSCDSAQVTKRRPRRGGFLDARRGSRRAASCSASGC